jgi:hypothetical protein
MPKAKALDFIDKLLDDWQRIRAEIRAIEELEHPPIIDRHKRKWVWKDKDLYTHDGVMAWTRDMIERPNIGLPSPHLADNPNYAALCATCRQDWPT